MIQTSVTLVKAAAVIALVLLAFIVGRHDVAFAANFGGGHFFAHPPTASPYLLVFGSAMVGCLFSTDAWANVTFAAAEVRDPGRNLPRALIIGAAFVTVVYVCTNLAYLSVLPLSGVPGGATVAARGIQYATQDRVATAAAEEIFGAGGSVVMACAILLSTFGCANGLILGGARVYYAMACDGLMFAPIGRLSQRQVPAAALVLQAVWISVLCLSGTYTQLIQFVIFSVLLFYVVTGAGLFALRRTQPDVAAAVPRMGISGVAVDIHCPDQRHRAHARDRARDPRAVAARVGGGGLWGARVSGMACGGANTVELNAPACIPSI